MPTATAIVFCMLVCHAPLPAATAGDFSKWEAQIQAFEAADHQSAPPQNGVLFIGSSSIRKWNLETSFPGRKYINRGFGGSQIADSVHFADRIAIPYRPQVIVLYAGDNDIAAGRNNFV